MFLLKFETKIVQFEPTYKQMSVKVKQLNSKNYPWRRMDILFEKKPSLHKKL